ncbi:hypothetical protein D3C78_1414260 [compost metagenome]
MATADSVQIIEQKELEGVNLSEVKPQATPAAFALGVVSGIVGNAVYDGIKAAGNALKEKANDANAQSIYSAAPARKYACYSIDPTLKQYDNVTVAEIVEFGRN